MASDLPTKTPSTLLLYWYLYTKQSWHIALKYKIKTDFIRLQKFHHWNSEFIHWSIHHEKKIKAFQCLPFFIASDALSNSDLKPPFWFHHGIHWKLKRKSIYNRNRSWEVLFYSSPPQHKSYRSLLVWLCITYIWITLLARLLDWKCNKRKKRFSWSSTVME